MSPIEALYGTPPQAPFLSEALTVPSLHLNSQGEVFSGWAHRGDSGALNEFFVARRSIDAGWQQAERIVWEGYYPPSHVPGIHVTWIDAAPGRQPFLSTDKEFERGNSPSLALNRDGGALLVWAGAPDMRSARYESGGWAPTERFGGDAGFSVGPSIAGTFALETARWVTVHVSLQSIWSAYRTGSGWSEPVLLDERPRGLYFLIHASNGKGKEFLSWSREQTMVVRSGNDGGEDLIEGLSLIDPRLAVGEDGTGWVLARAQEQRLRPVALFCSSE